MDKVKYVIDGIAGTLTVGSLLNILPPIAALLSIVWLVIQINDRIRYGPSRRRNDD